MARAATPTPERDRERSEGKQKSMIVREFGYPKRGREQITNGPRGALPLTLHQSPHQLRMTLPIHYCGSGLDWTKKKKITGTGGNDQKSAWKMECSWRKNKTRGISHCMGGKYHILQKSYKTAKSNYFWSLLEHDPSYFFNTVAKLMKTFPNRTISRSIQLERKL